MRGRLLVEQNDLDGATSHRAGHAGEAPGDGGIAGVWGEYADPADAAPRPRDRLGLGDEAELVDDREDFAPGRVADALGGVEYERDRRDADSGLARDIADRGHPVLFRTA